MKQTRADEKSRLPRGALDPSWGLGSTQPGLLTNPFAANFFPDAIATPDAERCTASGATSDIKHLRLTLQQHW